ncbi:paraquat-inducible protein A [Ferrimonas balearica]|uniref:paraquat-inducible protein A n=1 Tax=Ferrimonas balearica TaxID=44012 RepID=UPI001C9A1B94|nr:paraquat-inducible protein A [Ferrimonas balearica]MBY5991571.1 paraquat-inducible protein A [Ferrimonas balearica]
MSSRPVLCPTCDTYVRRRALPRGMRAFCPRCHSRIYDNPYCDTGGLMALTLAALVLYFPANLLPILEIDLVGNLRQTTVLYGALVVMEQGFVLVGLAVLVAGVIAPLLLLLSILTQLTLMRMGTGRPIVRWLLLHQPTLDQLSMIEIYMISFFVSVFKLVDIADLTYGWGTLCYILLFVLTFYVQYEYNRELMWHQYEEIYGS